MIEAKRRRARVLYRIVRLADHEFAYLWIGVGVAVILAAGVMV